MVTAVMARARRSPARPGGDRPAIPRSRPPWPCDAGPDRRGSDAQSLDVQDRGVPQFPWDPIDAVTIHRRQRVGRLDAGPCCTGILATLRAPPAAGEAVTVVTSITSTCYSQSR